MIALFILIYVLNCIFGSVPTWCFVVTGLLAIVQLMITALDVYCSCFANEDKNKYRSIVLKDDKGRTIIEDYLRNHKE